MIPLSVPSIKGNAWKYVKECLDTGWVSSAGAYVDRLEREICAFTGAQYAVACASGTAALHLALLAAGVQPGDEVIIPSLTFIAPVNTIRYVQAEPVFMDSDAYYNLDVEKTIRFLETETVQKKGFCYNKQSGRRISAIIPVHLYGNAVNLELLAPQCKERNIRLIEDATESLGTRYISGAYAGKHAGAIGDLGCYSFNGNKIITSGGGGVVVCNDEQLAKRVRYLSTQAKDDPLRYIHNEVGYNYRLTNIQAALGVAQLELLNDYLPVKKEHYLFYQRAINEIPGLHLAETPPYAESNYWFYCLQTDAAVYGKDRETLMALFSAEQIQTRPIWYPSHWQKPYKHNQAYEITKAVELWEQTLNIPCSVELTGNEMTRVIEVLRR